MATVKITITDAPGGVTTVVEATPEFSSQLPGVVDWRVFLR